MHFLNTNNLILIIDILNKYFERSSTIYIFILDILSKISNAKEVGGVDKFVLLNLSGEEVEKINGRTTIYYNKVKKEGIEQVKGTGKGRGRGEKASLSKFMIPVPESYYENMPLETVSLKIDRNPNIGCFTLLNTFNKMNCGDICIDGSIVACGYKDGSIMIWVTDKNMKINITCINFFLFFS